MQSWAVELLKTADMWHQKMEQMAWGWVGNAGPEDGLAVSARKDWVICRSQQVMRKRFSRKRHKPWLTLLVNHRWDPCPSSQSLDSELVGLAGLGQARTT